MFGYAEPQPTLSKYAKNNSTIFTCQFNCPMRITQLVVKLTIQT